MRWSLLFVRFGLVAVVAVILNSCGGSGGDDTAPTVLSTSPTDAATRVLTTSVVTARFSENVDSATLSTDSFLLSFNPPVPGTVTYDDSSDTATFTPTAPLPPGEVFTATLKTGVEDDSGNSLAADFDWTFTTEKPLYRVSVNSSGVQGDGDSNDCEHCDPISADGRYVVFVSSAMNLVTNGNGQTDAYRHDWLSDKTIQVNLPNAADQAMLGPTPNGTASEPSINANGRFVAFYSGADNLVLNDGNSLIDIFVHDTETGATERANLPNAADQGTLGTEAQNGDSERARMSADGRYVIFESRATNLVLDDTNGLRDVFVHDRSTGETERVSVDSNGNQALGGNSGNAAISADGQFVAFESNATNLDLITADTNGSEDIFVHNRSTGETQRVSVDSNGAEADPSFGSLNPSLSADGRYLVFWSYADNLVASDTNGESDIFVHDRATGETTRVSVPNLADQATLGVEADDGAQYPSISADGRYVAYANNATNLVVGDTNGTYDVFTYDRLTSETRRLSLRESDGGEGDSGTSDWASISGDGRYVTFYTSATNLVAGDTNAVGDVFRALNQ
jgi:Tol biopolymer transport system component